MFLGHTIPKLLISLNTIVLDFMQNQLIEKKQLQNLKEFLKFYFFL